MAVRLLETTFKGFTALALESPQATLQILPELGAKVISLRARETQREFLWRQPDRPLQRVAYGTPFDQADISGWDECFPSIAEVPYPLEPWKNILVPDHGELWTLPWQWRFADDILCMWTHSVRFGYHFERSFRFTVSGAIEITYQVTNPTPFALHALWSMHPFFAVSPTSRVLLPPGVRVRIEISTGERIGPFLGEAPWPIAHDQVADAPVDLSVMGPPQPTTEKLYTTPLPEGWATLYHPDDEHFVAFTFDPAQVPFMGICRIRGGWPGQGSPAYTLLLEPCTGWPDRLDLATSRGAAMVVPGGATVQWHLTMHVGRTRAGLEACLQRPLDDLLPEISPAAKTHA